MLTVQPAHHCRFGPQVAVPDQVVVAAVAESDPREACWASATDPIVVRIEERHSWSAPAGRSSKRFPRVSSSSPPEKFEFCACVASTGPTEEYPALFFGGLCWVFALNVLEGLHFTQVATGVTVLREPCSYSYIEFCRREN